MARSATGQKPKASRLKVFQAQFGFYDSVVAAPSQPAALRAWGTHQNLFADGQARVTTDTAAVEAALAHPEVPLRRPLGSTGAFEVEPTALPTVPDMPKRKSPQPKRDAKLKERPKPLPDRSSLDAAERALADLDAGRKAEESAFKQRQDDLDAEIAAAREAYLAGRKTAKAALTAAREVYRKAGGAD